MITILSMTTNHLSSHLRPLTLYALTCTGKQSMNYSSYTDRYISLDFGRVYPSLWIQTFLILLNWMYSYFFPLGI